MRTLSALLMVLLLCSVQQVCSGVEGADTPLECCTKLTKLKKIPLARIESYRWTGNYCPTKAVVFQMVGGKSFCVDPSWNWVESHMKKLPEKKKTFTASEPNTSSKR